MSTRTNRKSEGGSGGKLGHSNQSHREGTAFVKMAARKQRRADSKRLTGQGSVR